MKAYYDPKTDTIHNCKIGSRTYLHELRHRQQHFSKWWRAANYATSLSAITGAGLSFFAYMLYLAGSPIGISLWGFSNVLLVTLFIYRMAEEIDAHVYSIIKYDIKNQK